MPTEFGLGRSVTPATAAAAATAAGEVFGLGETSELEGFADHAGNLLDDAVESFFGGPISGSQMSDRSSRLVKYY